MLEKLDNIKLVDSVVVLNDFFLDRIISISDLGMVYGQILEKSKLGGSIRGIPQKDLKGGNATNVAYALARLGCPVSLITVADKAGSALITETFSEFENASLFVIDGKPGRTTALEFRDGKNIVNIMLSDLGDNENFGPEKLGAKEQQALKNSKAVILTNWASNKKGTELSKFAFEKSDTALHFIDPADIQTRPKEFKEAINELHSSLNSLCLNENECNILLRQHGLGTISDAKGTKKLVQELAKKILVAIDLHTTSGSYWSNGNEAEFVKSFQVKPVIVTGAGDVWDAANIVGYLANLSTQERLVFANGASALYIKNTHGDPPTLHEVLSFIAKN
ncbi:MAG: carbohydrate kinase family protein [Nitrosotalea sp.]